MTAPNHKLILGLVLHARLIAIETKLDDLLLWLTGVRPKLIEEKKSVPSP